MRTPFDNRKGNNSGLDVHNFAAGEEPQTTAWHKSTKPRGIYRIRHGLLNAKSADRGMEVEERAGRHARTPVSPTKKKKLVPITRPASFPNAIPYPNMYQATRLTVASLTFLSKICRVDVALIAPTCEMFTYSWFTL